MSACADCCGAAVLALSASALVLAILLGDYLLHYLLPNWRKK